MGAGRLTHGRFDVRLVCLMAGLEDEALVEYVSAALATIQPDGAARVETLEDAVEVADALTDALGLTAEARREAAARLGMVSREARCARFLLADDGRILRDLRPGEAGPCGFGCADGSCLAECAPDPALARALQARTICQKQGRAWPRAGGVDAQCPSIVWWFQMFDEAAALAAARAIREPAGRD